MLSTTKVDSDPRLDIFKPYNPYDLRKRFLDALPGEVYTCLCREKQCKPNAHVFSLLSCPNSSWDTLSVVDISKTYIGPKGFIPLMDLCRHLLSLKRLVLSDNYLQNESIWHLSGMAMSHPTLSEIDISENKFISWTGGMCLAQTLLYNTQLTSIWVYQTSIPTNIAQGIFQQTRKNAVKMFGTRGGCRKFGDHVDMIKLRALQRFFETVQSEDGCIPKDALEAGFRERLRIEGKDLGDCDSIVDFTNSLSKRMVPERVSWEAFIILIMIEGATYSSTLVSALRKVFSEFDVCLPENASQNNVDGYVEVKSFADIYVRLYEESPKEQDLTYLQSYFSLPNEQTVDWSNFLYIWYPRPLQSGEKSIGSTLTSLPRATSLWHY